MTEHLRCPRLHFPCSLQTQTRVATRGLPRTTKLYTKRLNRESLDRVRVSIHSSSSSALHSLKVIRARRQVGAVNVYLLQVSTGEIYVVCDIDAPGRAFSRSLRVRKRVHGRGEEVVSKIAVSEILSEAYKSTHSPTLSNSQIIYLCTSAYDRRP